MDEQSYERSGRVCEPSRASTSTPFGFGGRGPWDSDWEERKIREIMDKKCDNPEKGSA